MKELTRAEEQIMMILWKIRRGFVKDILEHFNDPKPAYNTVSTIVRILQEKGFVSHKAYGRTHEYFPIVSKKAYSKMQMGNFINSYFSNSYEQMVSFFAREKEISIKEMEEIMKLMSEEIKKQKRTEK
jgi:BlaI family transcriptional regulator, penicillinase repressor